MLDDAALRRLVLSRPIPDALIRDLGDSELRLHIRYYTSAARMLTPALYETLKRVARGETTPQIAGALGISYAAAQEYVKRLLAMFDVRNRTELAAKCYRERIV